LRPVPPTRPEGWTVALIRRSSPRLTANVHTSSSPASATRGTGRFLGKTSGVLPAASRLHAGVPLHALDIEPDRKEVLHVEGVDGNRGNGGVLVLLDAKALAF